MRQYGQTTNLSWGYLLGRYILGLLGTLLPPYCVSTNPTPHHRIDRPTTTPKTIIYLLHVSFAVNPLLSCLHHGVTTLGASTNLFNNHIYIVSYHILFVNTPERLSLDKKVAEKRWGKHYLWNPRLWWEDLRTLVFLARKRNVSELVRKVWVLLKH